MKLHNIRETHGKSKGRFVKIKNKIKLEQFLEETAGKQGRCRSLKLENPLDTTTNQVKKTESAISGRWIIELEKLANMWCNLCHKPLSVSNIEYEKLIGLVSKWRIRCCFCNHITEVETGKKSKKIYNTNIKLAVGMLDAGLGEAKINTILSPMNIPTMEDKSLKRYERYFGTAVEVLAKKSCITAMEEEKRSTITHQGQYNGNNDKTTDLIASFDAAWIKRTRQHNSFSGHSSLIDFYNKKVIGYACRSIYCKQCKLKTQKNIIVEKIIMGLPNLWKLIWPSI